MSEAPVLIVKDKMDPARAAAMAATLGRPVPTDVLPPFWHHAHFWEARPAEALGRDGHPRQGVGLVPDTGFPRRMWAGGDITWHAPLRLGVTAEKHSRLLSMDEKTGRSGPFVLVKLEHRVVQNGATALVEVQSLVYRPDPGGDAPSPPLAPESGRAISEVSADPVKLFRYSALTFNGHRIHYDAVYATEVEGHGGLVVHGPILAEALIDAAGAPRRFRYRATAPLLVGETGTVFREGDRLWIRGPEGRLCMTGEVPDAGNAPPAI